MFPVFKSDSLIGRYDSVTGQTPEIDLTNEDSARNISRRHARIVVKDGKPYVAEEIGTMNGTYLNGQKMATGVLTPINDGDELTLCRLGPHLPPAARAAAVVRLIGAVRPSRRAVSMSAAVPSRARGAPGSSRARRPAAAGRRPA